MAPRYKITLTSLEREQLETMTRRETKISVAKFVNARILLLCDCGEYGPAWKVADVASALGITSRTVEHLKQRFVEEGLDVALERKASSCPPRSIIFDGDFDAKLMALACSPAPAGMARWTVRLLADKAVELQFASSVSIMTIQRSLKKTNCVLT